jgi:hypothetical protein
MKYKREIQQAIANSIHNPTLLSSLLQSLSLYQTPFDTVVPLLYSLLSTPLDSFLLDQLVTMMIEKGRHCSTFLDYTILIQLVKSKDTTALQKKKLLLLSHSIRHCFGNCKEIVKKCLEGMNIYSVDSVIEHVHLLVVFTPFSNSGSAMGSSAIDIGELMAPLLKLWKLFRNVPSLDHLFLDFFSRLRSQPAIPGLDSWEEIDEWVYTLSTRLLHIPVGSTTTFTTFQHKSVSMDGIRSVYKSLAVYVVFSLSSQFQSTSETTSNIECDPKSIEVQRFKTLITTINHFTFKSNRGAWTNGIVALLSALCQALWKYCPSTLYGTTLSRVNPIPRRMEKDILDDITVSLTTLVLRLTYADNVIPSLKLLYMFNPGGVWSSILEFGNKLSTRFEGESGQEYTIYLKIVNTILPHHLLLFPYESIVPHTRMDTGMVLPDWKQRQEWAYEHVTFVTGRISIRQIETVLESIATIHHFFFYAFEMVGGGQDCKRDDVVDDDDDDGFACIVGKKKEVDCADGFERVDCTPITSPFIVDHMPIPPPLTFPPHLLSSLRQDYLPLFLSSLFSLIHELSPTVGVDQNPQERMLIESMVATCRVVFNSMDWGDALIEGLKRYLDQVTPHATVVVARVIASIPNCSVLIPTCIDMMDRELNQGACSTDNTNSTHPHGFSTMTDCTFHWYQSILAHILVVSNPEQYDMEKLERFLMVLIDKCKGRVGWSWTCDVFKNVVKRCTMVGMDCNGNWLIPTNVTIAHGTRLADMLWTRAMDGLAISKRNGDCKSIRKWLTVLHRLFECTFTFCQPNPTHTSSWIDDDEDVTLFHCQFDRTLFDCKFLYSVGDEGHHHWTTRVDECRYVLITLCDYLMSQHPDDTETMNVWLQTVSAHLAPPCDVQRIMSKYRILKEMYRV